MGEGTSLTGGRRKAGSATGTGHRAPPGPAPVTGPALRRALSLPVITFYGIGTIVGAGIYVLVGKVAGVAGMQAPVAFAVAAIVAVLTAFSYAELSSRFPLSAGEALYVEAGLGLRPLSVFVGLLIVTSGIVSSAAIARGFVGYLHVFVDVPAPVAIALLVVALGVVAAWGIAESAALAVVSTLAEVGGLLLVIWVARHSVVALPARLPELIPGFDAATWSGIALGAFLAFYAFIGFEDMVNVAEEVRDPVRTMPVAILLATGATVALYLVLAVVAVLSVPVPELDAAEAPLALIYQRATGGSPAVITVIGLFAVVNGGLIQMIMAARALYGMSRQGWLPAFLGVTHPRTQTPLRTTAIVTAAVLVVALALPVEAAASLTSLVVLVVFSLVNLALVRLRHRAPARLDTIPAAAHHWRCWRWTPHAALALCLVLIVAQLAVMLPR